MCATFLACGYTAGEIERMFRTTNFKAFKDAKKGILAKMENLYPDVFLSARCRILIFDLSLDTKSLECMKARFFMNGWGGE